MSIKPSLRAAHDLNASADAEFGPCLIRDCPTSVFATTDLDALWNLDTAIDPEAAATML
jgi:hypothetical protein